MESSVLIIYTGGTIGMKTNPETGTLCPFNFQQIVEEVPELKKFGMKLDTISFDPVIDSSNVSPEVWCKLANVIRDNYDNYDGFVILHGTDTMSYTASALSFMMHNLAKPIIFTGSQIPIGVLRTDAKENLITSIEIAGAKENGHSIVPEVCIYFQDKLYRANRTVKHNAEHFNAYRSDNYPPLAEVGIKIHYNYPYIRKIDSFRPSFGISTDLDCSVAVIRVFPGIQESIFRSMLEIEGLKGVILETYGSGNAPTAEWFIGNLQKAIDKGLIILNVTQCHAGSVEMERYKTGKRLRDIGVISGHDITTESALTKMIYLLGQNMSKAKLIEQLNSPIRGEITIE